MPVVSRARGRLAMDDVTPHQDATAIIAHSHDCLPWMASQTGWLEMRGFKTVRKTKVNMSTKKMPINEVFDTAAVPLHLNSADFSFDWVR